MLSTNHTWQSLVDDDMVKTRNVSQMVIYNIENHNRVAGTTGWWLPTADILQVVDVFERPEHYLINNLTMFASIPEVTMQFLMIKADARSFYGKRGATSVFAGRSAKLVVVAWCEGSVMPGQTANAVEKLLDYFHTYKL
jgi:profilin